MTTIPLHVEAVGMACPIGLTAATACAALRAGIDRRRELAYFDDDGSAIIGSALRALPEGMPRRQRWLHLLALALRDLSSRQPSDALTRTTLFLKLPRDEERTTISSIEIARHLSAELGAPLEPSQFVLAEEAVDAYQLLVAGREHLSGGKARACVVAAADSLIDARSLLALVRQNRLKTPRNADGVIPGEAAACIRLTLRSPALLARISGIGSAVEPGLLTNDIPLRGEGIAEAARLALTEAGLAMHDLDFRLSDAAGEAYHFKEQVLVIARLLRRNMAGFPLWLPARALGHVGHAGGMCNLVWAVVALARGYAPGPRAIAFSGDAQGLRSAAVVERPEGRR